MEGREWWCWAIIVVHGRGSLLAVCPCLVSVGCHVCEQSSLFGGRSSLSRGGVLLFVGQALFVGVGCCSLVMGHCWWVSGCHL